MNQSNSLMPVLMDIAEEMIGGGERIPAATFEAAAALLPAPCDQEEIAALALAALLTEHGRLAIRAGDLMARLSRRSPVRPRWDVVLPRLARKGLLVLADGRTEDGTWEPAEITAVSADTGTGFRDVKIALLLDAENEDLPCPEPGYASNREYLEDCFAYIERLHDELSQQDPPAARGAARRFARNLAASQGDDGPDTFSTDVEAQRRAIRHKAQGSACVLPLEVLRARHGLDDREWHILLHILRRTMQGEDTEVRDLMVFFGGSAFVLYDMRKFFLDGSALVRDDIIVVKDSNTLLRSDVEIADAFDEWLITGGEHHETDAAPVSAAERAAPFADNEEYLEKWLTFVVTRIQGYKHRGLFSGRRMRIPYQALATTPDFLQLRSRSEACLSAEGGTERFPFEAIVAAHGLDDFERLILLVGLQAALDGHWIDIPDVLPLLAANFGDFVRLRRYFTREARIVAKDLIDVRIFGFGAPDFAMNRAAVARVLGDEQNGETALLSSEIFTEVRPGHTLEQLQLPDAERARLEAAVRGVSREVCARLESWGVRGVTARREPSSLLLLFSGGPGTGKTFAAEALAGTLGRSLLVTDISRLLSKWVGDSEQNVAQLFKEYREICKRRDEAPVLLLNECDQFLSHRSVRAERSVDRMYHQMQNLFLENLETFPGILVATTNMVESLDDAFSRRFDEKIVFPLPDANVRLRLWETHLPADVPRQGDLDLGRIAARYAFSGGQIAVTAANALRRAALRGDCLRMEDLEEACRNEARGTFGGEVVGFRV